MDLQNNIGKHIKTKLEDLYASPDASVWQNIEAELKRKKRRRLFVWWFFGGASLVAAVLLFNFPFYQNMDMDNPNNSNTILSTETRNSKTHKTISEKEIKTEDFIATEDELEIPTNETNAYGNAPQASNKTNSKSNKKLKRFKSVFTNQNSEETASNDTNTSNQIVETKTKEFEKTIDTLFVVDVVDKDETEDFSKKRDDFKEKLKDSIGDKSSSRWSVTPQGILSYYGSFKGSTSNNTSYNYAFLASYKMNSKLYARTGVRVLNLNQNSNGTEREIRYLQFPLELKYAPFQNKLNPYAIGGFSYYSLKKTSDNNASENFQATTGLNLGLGLETKIFNNIYINTEGIFNYQIMPFSEQNDVKPYLLNFSLGIEYRF